MVVYRGDQRYAGALGGKKWRKRKPREMMREHYLWVKTPDAASDHPEHMGIPEVKHLERDTRGHPPRRKIAQVIDIGRIKPLYGIARPTMLKRARE